MDESESPVNSDPAAQKKYKLMLSLWLSFCIVGFIWFVTKVLKGRQRIRYNFSSIEEQLKKMQTMMEEKDKELEKKGITEEGDSKNVKDDGGKVIEEVLPANNNQDDEKEDTENVCNGERIVDDTSKIVDNESDKINVSRSRKTKDIIVPQEQLIGKDSVDLIRGTIENIITEGVNEVGEQNSKKDN